MPGLHRRIWERHLWTLVATLVIVALFAVACGGAPAEEPAPAEEEEAAPAEEEAAPAEEEEAAPAEEEGEMAEGGVKRGGELVMARLEEQCDRFNADLTPLRSFILPGGTPAAALLHVARTTVRRAERATWAALYDHGEDMNAVPATYLNRLSDLLFILCRHANRTDDGTVADVMWEPGRRQS